MDIEFKTWKLTLLEADSNNIKHLFKEKIYSLVSLEKYILKKYFIYFLEKI